MPRWEGDAVGRLERAALELFDERGFDRTTVAEIAKRAGLAERSFYRYFSDKREALFASDEELVELLAQAVRDAPGDMGSLDALLGGVREAERLFRPKDFLRVRERVIDANPELRERELRKTTTLVTTLVAAVRERGTDETTARVATDMAMWIWRLAAEHWARDEDATWPDEVTEAARQFRQIAAEVTAG
jgi:AcrR family transcriptional regulator